MRLGALGTAAAMIALALPAAAHANPWQVRPGAGTCGEGDTQCGTIQQADDVALDEHTIQIFPTPGGWLESVQFDQARLTVAGGGAGAGQAVVRGTLTFTGAGTFTIQGLTVLPASGSALAFTTDAVTGSKTVSVQSSILSGSGSAAAITAGTAVSLNPISITARHVTIADSGSAPAVAETQNGGAITTTFHDSIVQGTTVDGVNAPSSNNDTSPNAAALFANPGQEDFHLRVGSPAINAGGTQGGTEVTTDIDGEPRSNPWDRGGDEFVNHAPSKADVALLSSSSQERGRAFSFGASASDPDAALQDSVNGYEWNFGDGTVEMRPGGAQSFHSHAYAAVGTYQVTVRAIDRTGAFGPASDPVSVTVTTPPPGGGNPNTPVGPGGVGLPGIDPNAVPAGPDTAPPLVGVDFPAHNQAVKLARGPRARTPMLRGGNADDSGVRRVELALVRRAGARCLWYDGRARFVAGSCTRVRWFRGTVDDYSWRHVVPRGFRPSPGAYGLLVRAFDYAGNASSTFSAPARTAVSFSYVR
ncbi:MAG TPA: PKD domain-containing protein [Solirubrobacteraceae bacterium]|nr:PKD domain-containing protein [Solirubrobacteraceae bacterium]